jgi:GMP synthase-like glutamine amidotransferase
MAIAHRNLPIVGLQFHPESILTQRGYEILASFLRLARISFPNQLATPADGKPAIPSAAPI